MPSAMDSVTIHDVAKKAGVSISTVSRVLNGLDRVAPETKKKVEAAVKKLKFFPNSRAQSLSRKRTDMLALIVPDFQGEYFTKLMEGAHECCENTGINLMVLKAKSLDAKMSAVTQLLSSGRVDGLILMMDQHNDEILQVIQDARQPLVILDQDVGHWRLDNILVDNRTGSLEITNHLIVQHGIKNFFFLGGPENNVDTQSRAQGFKDALNSNGINFDNKMYFMDYEYDEAYRIVQQEIIENLNPSEKYGIVAANDDIACGAIDSLTENGFNVPDQIAVTGFDDSHLAIRRRLKLTTVGVPLREIGQASVKTILNRMINKNEEPAKVILKGKLIIRESCGCKSRSMEDISSLN